MAAREGLCLDYKIRVVGAPITKDARVFIMVNRARTTFAEMIPLIRAEAAKQDPPLLLPHEYDLVELDITEAKPTVKQQLNANDTPDSANMAQAVVMIKKRRKDLKIRVVGGPVPKAARLFIDVSRARTTFADMLGLIRAEAAKLDPPVSLTDAFDLVELDMADGKPRPKQALMGGDTAESAKMTSPVVMLKPRAVQLSPLTASLRRGSYSHSGMVVVAPQDTERVAVVDMDATDLASMMSTDGEGVQEERFEWEWSPVTNAAAAQRASSLDPLQWSSRHLSLEPCPMMASEGSWSLPHSLDEADDEAAVWR